MFQNIQEGIEAYKESIREHLQQINEVDNREKEGCNQRGLGYRGISNWPMKDCHEFTQRNYKLNGMATALGLTEEEVKTIWKDIEKELGIRK